MEHTDCCIVGSGPGGALLALLLARRGVRVTLLESQRDFDRDFRGNTLSPAALAILDELGLTERLLSLRHAKIPRFSVATADGPLTFADFSRLPTRYPYILMLPQSTFLELLIDEARAYSHFQLVMGAKVRELVVENEAVQGVRFRVGDTTHELRATLTVGADGRFSTVRKLANIPTLPGAAPIDVLWFRLPRSPNDPDDAEALFRFGHGALLALMDHGDSWQIGYIMAKDNYPRLRKRGFAAFQQAVADLVPDLADRVWALQGWNECALLPVESSRAECWYKPGLLLIGDAAHVMSPVGGVGINCALQDARVAALVLAEPLRNGTLNITHVRRVQRRREWPTRVIQAGQQFAHRQVVDGALASNKPFRIPPWLRLALRLPVLGQIPARLIAFGGVRE